jgi:RNA polymerase sigma factor for flagellar operon FliA
MGLIEAVDNYDLSYGTKFSTYAVPRIRGKILDYLRKRDWLPRSARTCVKAIQQAMKTLRYQLGRVPTNEEIAQNLDLKVKDVQQALTYASVVIVSLDSFVPWLQDESETFEEYIVDEKQKDPSQLYYEKALKERLGEALRKLEDRDQIILSLYYFEELTLKEIGEVIGVSESRVCQLHARAVIDLKNLFAEESQNRKQAVGSSSIEQSEVLRHV